MSSTPRDHLTPIDAPSNDLVGFPPRCELVGETLRDKYRVIDHIGQGGLSDVFEVRYIAGGCRQAMKVLRPDASDEDARRFEHEYRTLLHLNHPGLVRVHDFDRLESGQPYFTMELLHGRSLERVFDVGERVKPARVLRLAVQVCSALAALHRQRIIHRDIKPGNIFLLDSTGCSERDRVKVIDLGIARLTTGYYEAASNVLELTPRSQRLRTRPGFVVGTPGYIAPECGDGPTDARQDMYSVGVTMYRLLTGKRAYPADDPSYVSIASYLPDAPQALTELVERALARDPAARFESMELMIAAIEDVLEQLTSSFRRPPEPKPERRWPSVLVGAAMGVSATALLFSWPSTKSHEVDRGAQVSPAVVTTPNALPPVIRTTAPVMRSRDVVVPTTTGAEQEPAVTPIDRAEVDRAEADLAAPSGTKKSKRRGPEPRAVFRRVMSGAGGQLSLCLSTAPVDTGTRIKMRVRVEGRAAELQHLEPPLPALADGCVRDVLAGLEFPKTLSGTFTHGFTR